MERSSKDTKGSQGELDSKVPTAAEQPVLDEEVFQQLLAAAYVIQQQADESKRLPESIPISSDDSRTSSEEALAVIAETQERLRTRIWEIVPAASLVAEALQRITNANGVAIALEREGILEYCSVLGTASGMAGFRVPMPESLLSIPGAAVAPDDSVNGTHSSGEENDIALPLSHDEKVVGVLEVHFEKGKTVPASERHRCQLMAGLMVEAIARATEAKWRQALTAERAVMIEELERIVPQVDTPAQTTQVQPSSPIDSHIQTVPAQVPDTSAPAGEAAASRDRSNSRHRRSVRSEKRRSKPEKTGIQVESQKGLSTQAQILAVQQTQVVTPSAEELGQAGNNQVDSTPPFEGSQEQIGDPWISAAKTRRWLESLQKNGSASQWFNQHRADLYLAGAVAILVLSIGWLAHSPHPAGVQSKNQQPTLSWFQRILVDLDLAEAPTAPTYLGNPNAMVWVDLHTALYYCAGAELYGNTAGGKFTTQRDAQIDQFQPAERKTCN
jgi:hypothetical protein